METRERKKEEGVVAVAAAAGGPGAMGSNGRRRSKVMEKRKKKKNLLGSSCFCSLKNGEDILGGSLEWQSGRCEEYSQEESLSECQLEE